MKSLLEAPLRRLAAHQIAHPWRVVLVVLLTLIPAIWATSRLQLREAFSELLPSDKPSVVELERIKNRLPSSGTLTVVAEGASVPVLERFVDALTPRLLALGPAWVSSVDIGPKAAQNFFEKNQHLYADLKDIQQLHDEIKERYDYEVGKRAGFDLGLDESADEAPPPISADEVERRFRDRAEKAKQKASGVDGYYIDKNTRVAAILVRTPLSTADSRTFVLRKKIADIIAELDPKRFDAGIKIGYTGNLITSAEEHDAVTKDLANVGTWGVAGILTVVFLFFLRVRTLIAMTLTIGVGCVWAFGLAKLTVGYLNSATGFLVSIIAGNGINFGIIYMARYLEARRLDRLDVSAAIVESHVRTHTATLSAAAAAAVAYGSLAVTDFKGFKHFGIIGGLGMLVCWIATYAFLPAVLVISETHFPMFAGDGGWRARLKGVYGVPFAWIARRLPRGLTAVGLALGIASTVLAVGYFRKDPMEYDMRNVRNVRRDPTSAGALTARVDKIVGRLGQDGRAIVTERLDQVKPLVAVLEARRAAAPAKDKPFDRVVSIYDLLPKDQDAKIALLKETRDLLEHARKRGFISDSDWSRIEPHIPAKLASIGIPNLPPDIVRSFTERGGTRGRIVYIVPTTGRSVYDAHYLMHWADSFREVKLPNGDVIRGTGDPVIFSDMLLNIGEDAPKAVALSLLGTLIVVLIAFRGRAAGWLALGTLLMGLSWLVAFLALEHIKLNFLNFVALPISIGVGADYAINVLKRSEHEPAALLPRALAETGGAVVLCSLTTTLGYLALLLSINRAVKSFGLAGAVGELTTLLSAVLVLPAFLFWRRAASARSSQPDSAVANSSS